MPEPKPESVNVPHIHQEWPPPKAWSIQAFSADGTVIAEVSRRPHHPPVVSGDPECLQTIIREVLSSCRFFTPPGNFNHGMN
ncbi:MAG: hypothetical protein WCS43_15555 [Verrucomicrobiota bacterium]